MEDAKEAVLAKIERDEMVKLALDLGNIPSPRGYEKEAADYVFAWLEKHGFEAFRQEVVTGRPNVIGVLRGTGNGLNLIFNSHLDHALGLPIDIWAHELKPIYTKAWIEGDAIFGQSVVNDKGPMTAFLIAAKAIKESGIKLKGDLFLTCVMGEIANAPIDEFQGPLYVGKGVGTRHLVTHGVVADYAVVAEATDFRITWVEAGDVWFKITVRGEYLYTPYIVRPTPPEKSPNAVVKMARLIMAIEEWAYKYEVENNYRFSGGVVVPKVCAGAVRGGLPFMPAITPSLCSIYVDVRLPPGKGPLEAKEQLCGLLRKLEMDGDIQMYLYRKGYEGENVSQIVESAEKAHEYVFGVKPEKVDSPTTSMWRDVNIFNEVGIPAITCGPGAGAGGGTNALKIEELINAAKLYAFIALDICSRDKKA